LGHELELELIGRAIVQDLQVYQPRRLSPVGFIG